MIKIIWKENLMDYWERYWEERQSQRTPSKGDGRTAYEVDYARVIHSSSFRRLQGKTQIHQGESDVPRTRMTHSLEVAQIALGISQRIRDSKPERAVANLVSSPALIQVVGLCHDLGHPCGGHAGEEALNAMIPYEGNGQTLRILTRLESHTPGYGSNLSRRSLLGILKYPIKYSDASKGPTPPPRLGRSGVPLIGPEHSPPKCYLDSEEDIVQWMLEPYGKSSDIIRSKKYKSFDAGLMDIADDFAYSAADLDDAIAMGMMKRQWLENDLPSEIWDPLAEFQTSNGNPTKNKTDIFDRLMGSSNDRRKQTGSIINYLLSGISVKERMDIGDPIYRFEVIIEEGRKRLVESLKDCVFKRVIKSEVVQVDRMRIQRRIIEVYDALSQFPERYLPEKYREIYISKNEDERVIADYIAGMTDRFLATTHKRMYG